MTKKLFILLYLVSCVVLATPPHGGGNPGGGGGGGFPPGGAPGVIGGGGNPNGGFGPGDGVPGGGWPRPPGGNPGGGVVPPPGGGGGGVVPPPGGGGNGGGVGGIPGGGRGNFTYDPTVNARANAVARANGGSATVNNYGGGYSVPANQTIRYINTPGLGGLFVSGSQFDCVINTGGSGTTEGAGFQIIGPILSRPCYLAFLARQQMNGASVAYSVGHPEMAEQSMTNAVQLTNCGDETTFITSKATGFSCAVMPDRDFLDNYMGGMPRAIVAPNPAFIKPVVRRSSYTPPPIPNSRDDNPKYDAIQRDEMLK